MAGVSRNVPRFLKRIKNGGIINKKNYPFFDRGSLSIYPPYTELLETEQAVITLFKCNKCFALN